MSTITDRRVVVVGDDMSTIIDRRGEAVGDVDPDTSGFQEVTSSSDTIDVSTVIVVINRSAPSTTGLTLPDASRRSGAVVRIVDFSQSVTAHTITLTPFSVGQKIMRQSTYTLFSNDASLAAISLRPIVDPDDASNYVWVYAP